MSNLLMFYIADILNECGMDKNPQAQDMLLREFTHIYKECLLKYDPEYAKKISEKKASEQAVDKYGYFETSCEEELPENEQAFREAKERFGVQAIVDKAYVTMDTYKHYQFLKKMSIMVLRILGGISCLIAFYGIAYANDADAKMLTLLLWVIDIIVTVSFAIVFNSADSKLEKIFDQITNKFTYFSVKDKQKEEEHE